MLKTISIDEEGFFVQHTGIRLTEETTGQKMLASMQVDNFGVTTLEFGGEKIIVEAFDKPYVIKQIHIENNQLKAQMPYQHHCAIELNSFCLDDWDRFHVLTTSGIPAVFSRAAQAELFNLASEFDDDNLTILNTKVSTPPYYQNSTEVNKAPFWTEKYQQNPSPSWNLDQPHPELTSIMQQLKINKLRVLVPGCGLGHDAAFLAEQGHIVTAFDISESAITEAKKRYGHIKTLTFLVADVFNLDEEHHNSYDLVFEHTCYCAISPDQRETLIKKWRQCLAETGHILGIFFVVPKRSGPYFGGSEWELREKLEASFKFFYWTRLRHSPGWRQGAELMVYAQIRASV